MAAAAATTIVLTATRAELVALAGPPQAVLVWNVRVPALLRLDDAPIVLGILAPLRASPPPRVHVCRVTPMKKLKAAARISTSLGLVTARMKLLRRNVFVRHHYTVLRHLAKTIRASARRLPHPDRGMYVGIGNRIRRVAARGRKTGGYPARVFRHLLRGVAAAVVRLQREPVELLLDLAAARLAAA